MAVHVIPCKCWQPHVGTSHVHVGSFDRWWSWAEVKNRGWPDKILRTMQWAAIWEQNIGVIRLTLTRLDKLIFCKKGTFNFEALDQAGGDWSLFQEDYLSRGQYFSGLGRRFLYFPLTPDYFPFARASSLNAILNLFCCGAEGEGL